MKRFFNCIFLLFSFVVLFSLISCKIIESFSILKREEPATEITVEEELPCESDNLPCENDNLSYENDTITENDNNYDTINSVLSDSLKIIIQEKLDAENSGEAIVKEADELMGMIDTLNGIPYFENTYISSDSKSENKYNYPTNYVPDFPDSIYAKRIEILNKQTSIELVFNKHVKSFIEVYAVQKRDKTSRILGLADIYFPLFERTLDKYNMPLELKYLAVVESALNPTAGSHAGAKGLWQFMYRTGKVYKLNVTSIVDDRYDPLRATEAACQHLQDLYDIYEDWFLVLAAYNSGSGNVNKAIRRSGGIKNYWAIWPYLPRETRGYVPAFIAVNYIMNYSQEHNIYPLNPGIIMDGVDTVMVHEPLAFDQLNEMLKVPMTDLTFFNPQYKVGIIPASAEHECVLRLPEKYINDFIDNEKELYAFKTKKGLDREKLEEKIKKVSDRSVHIVRSGENLSTIAKKYRVSVNQIKAWNNMRGTMIYPGQKLIVYNSGAPMAQAGNSNPVMRSTTQKVHTVLSGETLSSISKKYKCSITDLKKWNNLKSSVIKTGQKLKVYPPAKEYEQKVNTTTSDGYVIYTVKQGDNLWDIAKKFNGVTVEQIRKLNGLNNKAVLKIGQKLKIYKIKEDTSSSSSKEYVIHTIRSGDNLWNISKKYGVTVEQIRKLNGLSKNAVLKVGKKLKIKEK